VGDRFLRSGGGGGGVAFAIFGCDFAVKEGTDQESVRDRGR